MHQIADLLDDRNQKLHDEIIAQVPITLVESNDGSWGAILKNETALISCAKSAYPRSCFTHEMLHIRCDLTGLRRPGFVAGGKSSAEIARTREQAEELLVYAYNLMIHQRIFPQFAEMGFPANEFLNEDDHKAQARVERDIGRLQGQKKTKFRNGIPALLFIWPYLFISSPHDTSPHAKKLLNRIRNMSAGYFKVDSLMTKWRDDPAPDVRRYLARLFYLCDLPNVGFGPSEDKLVWARDCLQN